MKCCNSGSGAIYGLGVVGAAVYYLQHVTTLLAGAVGLVKAVFWPGVILYKVMGLLRL